MFHTASFLLAFVCVCVCVCVFCFALPPRYNNDENQVQQIKSHSGLHCEKKVPDGAKTYARESSPPQEEGRAANKKHSSCSLQIKAAGLSHQSGTGQFLDLHKAIAGDNRILLNEREQGKEDRPWESAAGSGGFLANFRNCLLGLG